MSEYSRIAILETESEALYLEAELKKIGVPFRLKDYALPAMDGILKPQKGWGHIEAPAEYAEIIIDIISNSRESSTDDDIWDEDESAEVWDE